MSLEVVGLDPASAAALGTVRVIGAGLLGTSIGLALSSQGTRVLLSDASPTTLALARDLGAGEPDPGGPARLTVVAVPPDVTAAVLAKALTDDPDTTVTDVASVKGRVLRELSAAGVDLSRYVGGHPMAGRERSGPLAARGDLFVGRPWVICPAQHSGPGRVDDVQLLVRAVGATSVTMPADQHDAAVALVSHVPQVAASLVAARLEHAGDAVVALAGQGLRDVTRIAASDPLLWVQILGANAGPVREVLHLLRDDLDAVIEDLRQLASPAAGVAAAADLTGSREPASSREPDRRGSALTELADLMLRGTIGRERIPGKHGGGPTRYAVVTVLIPDRPGQLSRLFADIGAAGINVEELTLEHAPGRAVGLMEISVLPTSERQLEQALAAGGWQVAG